MKKLLFVAAALWGFGFFAGVGVANAKYFRLIDVKHPQINAGTSIGNDFTRATTMVALVTHSPLDGYILIPGVDWTPLAVGGGFKEGNFHLAAGPSFNLLPVIKSGLAAIVNGVTDPDKYTNLKSLLAPVPAGGADITGALGINVEYDFRAGALTTPYFLGVKWKF